MRIPKPAPSAQKEKAGAASPPRARGVLPSRGPHAPPRDPSCVTPTVHRTAGGPEAAGPGVQHRRVRSESPPTPAGRLGFPPGLRAWQLGHLRTPGRGPGKLRLSHWGASSSPRGRGSRSGSWTGPRVFRAKSARSPRGRQSLQTPPPPRREEREPTQWPPQHRGAGQEAGHRQRALPPGHWDFLGRRLSLFL